LIISATPDNHIHDEAHAMTLVDFLHSLEEVLRQRRLSFSLAAAIALVESCWELIEDDPDVWAWSDRFCEAKIAAGYAAVEIE
jgi:hypothetical protein